MRAWIASLLVALACATGARSQEARVELQVEAGRPLWVGQQVTLSLTLMAPGYFASAPGFELPDPAGVLLMPPEGRPVVGNRTIDGVMYTTQLHELRAWPMRAGAQTIPPLTIRFAYKQNPLDADPVAASVSTEATQLDVEQPPGTADLGTVISARNLKVEETWQPEISGGPVEAGAAFTRTITFSAPDIPGMIFPPFPADDIEGLGVYSKPQVRDHNDQRGGFTGERREVITYLCKEPGQFTLPAVEFRWFDLESNRLRTETLAARTLDVVANPALASGTASPGNSVAGLGHSGAGPGWRRFLAVVLVLAAVVALAWNRRFRNWACGVLEPLRPVHLQPLNPPASPRGRGRRRA